MTNKEIKMASEYVEMKIKMRDKESYMSTLWLYYDGEILGTETLMYALGYKWNGQEFVGVINRQDKIKEC